MAKKAQTSGQRELPKALGRESYAEKELHAPPPNIVAELGERPSDSVKAQAWDKGVRDIETYRAEHGRH